MPNPTGTAYLTPNRQREDFDALVDPLPAFLLTTKVALNNFVEVYKDGLLQRAGSSEDYVLTVYIAGPGGNSGMKITPNAGFNVGEKWTAFYYPKE